MEILFTLWWIKSNIKNISTDSKHLSIICFMLFPVPGYLSKQSLPVYFYKDNFSVTKLWFQFYFILPLWCRISNTVTITKMVFVSLLVFFTRIHKLLASLLLVGHHKWNTGCWQCNYESAYSTYIESLSQYVGTTVLS